MRIKRIGTRPMRIRRGNRPYKILKTLAIAGGFIILSTIAPQSGAMVVKSLIRDYFRKKRFEREKFLRDLKSLQERQLVDYRELPSGEVKVTLTKFGKRKTSTYSLDEMKLVPQKYWDGLWRMVIFDIPHHQKKARDAFRRKLTDLG